MEYKKKIKASPLYKYFGKKIPKSPEAIEQHAKHLMKISELWFLAVLPILFGAMLNPSEYIKFTDMSIKSIYIYTLIAFICIVAGIFIRRRGFKLLDDLKSDRLGLPKRYGKGRQNRFNDYE